MRTLSLMLPDSIHKRLKELAYQEGISITQVIATAVAEKMSALTTDEYLQKRAQRAAGPSTKSLWLKYPMSNPKSMTDCEVT